MSRSIGLIAVTALIGMAICGPGLAADLKATPEEVKAGCEKVGGEYFPQGQTGTYGCENHDNGRMILCNKDNDCTVYLQAYVPADKKKVKIAGDFGLRKDASKR